MRRRAGRQGGRGTLLGFAPPAVSAADSSTVDAKVCALKPDQDVSGYKGMSDAAGRKRTRIICTLGPSSWSVEMLGVLLDEGMNVARLNFRRSFGRCASTRRAA